MLGPTESVIASLVAFLARAELGREYALSRAKRPTFESFHAEPNLFGPF